MVPVYSSSSPSSRRTRRRQQRYRQRCHRQQQSSEQLSKQTSNEQPASRPKDWLEMYSDDRLSADAAWIRPQSNEFDPPVTLAPHSNLFSVLDVGIPSPTLTVPISMLSEQLQRVDTSMNPDIYGIGVSTGCSISPSKTKSSKKLRLDSWASNLHREGLVKGSYDPLIRDMIVPPLTDNVTLESTQNPASLPAKSDNNCITDPVNKFRVPSPLLYHRRSNAACSEFQGSDQNDEGLSFTHTRLMSEIRSISQERQRNSSTAVQEPPFVAARLPLMGSAAASEDSMQPEMHAINSPKAKDNSVKHSLPPILTTTNLYLYPQKLYQIVDHPAESALNNPKIETLHPLWLSDQSLVFPTLTLSGQLPICKAEYANRNASPVAAVNEVVRPVVVGTDSAHFLDYRDRSSIQDSLDRDFTVERAVLLDDLKSKNMKLLAGSHINLSSSPRHMIAWELATELWQDKSVDASESNRTSEISTVESQKTVVITPRENDPRQVAGSLSAEPDNDLLDSVDVSKEDVVSSDDEWNWADDIWQSDVTTPQSLDESEIGLCAAEWV